MARDRDATLLETVRVRRRRLRDAFLHGALRARRTASDNVRALIVGLVVAAVACAACAAVSFIRSHTGDAKDDRSLSVVVVR
ncbi:hypothetical protein [Jatrophihabitans fulvus]